MKSIDLFWYFSGIGVMIFCFISSFGLFHYLMQLKPCKHEWTYVCEIHWEGKKVADRFRCIHCCKRKEV